MPSRWHSCRLASKGFDLRPKHRSFLRAILRWAIVPVVSFVLVVAVAMGCAVWSPFRVSLGTAGFAPMAIEDAPKALQRDDVEITWANETCGFGVSFYFYTVGTLGIEASQNDPEFRQVLVLQSGVPFKCLRWTNVTWPGTDDASVWVRGFETTRPSAPSSDNRRIPLMPEPVGMVLNVLIVSAAIVLPRMAWRRAVVARRRRKGLCLKCAYPIEPSVATCPECGEAYAKAARAEPNHA